MRLKPENIHRAGHRAAYLLLEEAIVEVPNNGSTFLHVINSGEHAVIVTIYPDDDYRGDLYGTVTAIVEPGIEGEFIGAFPTDVYGGHHFTAIFSSTEQVRVSALRLSRT